MFAREKSSLTCEILIGEPAWEETIRLFPLSLAIRLVLRYFFSGFNEFVTYGEIKFQERVLYENFYC